MAPKKKLRSTQGDDASSQVPQRTTRTSWTSTTVRTQGNSAHPVGLIYPNHVVCYTCLSSRLVIATRFYDEDLLAQLGSLDDIR